MAGSMEGIAKTSNQLHVPQRQFPFTSHSLHTAMSDHFEPPLASLSLTHVYYNPDDHVSLLCAWLALVPQVLVISYTTLTVAQRELEVLLMFAGQLSCEAVNWVLKRYFKQQRPKQMYGKGYGMPSSHAQFVGFFAVYFSLWMYLRARQLPIYQRAVIAVTAITVSIAVSLSRIYLSYHTPLQVACGYSVGVVFGLAWFGFTAWLRVTNLGEAGGGWGLEMLTGGRRLLDWILWATQIVYVKDMLMEVDLVRWEWEVWSKARGGRAWVEEGVKLLKEEKKKS